MSLLEYGEQYLLPVPGIKTLQRVENTFEQVVSANCQRGAVKDLTKHPLLPHHQNFLLGMTTV